MTDTDLQSKLVEREDVIRQLVTRLQEAIDENDRLKAELARLTEGASAYATLSDIHRNRDLPESVRLRAAIGCLPHELPKIQSVPPAIDVTAEPVRPLSEIVAEQRARCDRLLALPLEERERLIKGVVRHDGNGQDDDTGS